MRFLFGTLFVALSVWDFGVFRCDGPHDVQQVAAKAHALDWEGFFRAFREPDFIPGYEILNKLGGGVFGDVYKAKKTSIGKFYAIKFLKVLDEATRDDVLREIKSVDAFAQVDHPHLVSIEDKGEVKGVPFIVMSYAGDETLKTRLAQGPLPPVAAFPIFGQVLQGVAALHERSIIHFDLKPANVFLRGEVARVGDYGLSKLVTQSASHAVDGPRHARVHGAGDAAAQGRRALGRLLARRDVVRGPLRRRARSRATASGRS